MAEEEKLKEEAEAEAEKTGEGTEEKTAEPAEEAAAQEAEESASGEKGRKKKDRKAEKQNEELEKVRKELEEEKLSRLRLAAEYDNYRKRTAREKDHIYSDAVADTLGKILPIYDNLERALKQETADEAYKKGVQMIMTAMEETLKKCDVTAFGEPGETFNPEKHNAVMHTEDESLGENVITDVFQKGFSKGDKVIRFAMVKVAN